MFWQRRSHRFSVILLRLCASHISSLRAAGDLLTTEADLSRLTRALDAAGFAAPRPPKTARALDEVVRAIAPLQLPGDVRALWEAVDPASLSVRAFPELTTPEFALHAWRHHVATAPPLVPRRLFPLGYSSWTFLFVELDADGERDGGALFEWLSGGSDFQLAYDDVAHWLDVQITALDAGDFQVVDGHAHVGAAGERRLSDIGLQRLAERGPHPVWGTTTSVPEQWPWPARWR